MSHRQILMQYFQTNCARSNHESRIGYEVIEKKHCSTIWKACVYCKCMALRGAY
jgi:hypothetical protein